MDSSTLILIVALVLAVAAGPPIGFVLARRRLERKMQGRLDRSSRFADLDAQVRSLSNSAPPAPRPAAPIRSDDGPSGLEPPLSTAPGPMAVPQAPLEPVLASPSRFEDVPPAFAPVPPAPPTGRPVDPVPSHPAGRPQGGAPGESISAPLPSSDGAPAVADAGAALASPQFRPIADHVEDAVKLRMAWLADVSSGRMLALHRLGYDDPVKIANLRPVEVSRLARALHVAEREIEEEWMPAARRELGMRRFGA